MPAADRAARIILSGSLIDELSACVEVCALGVTWLAFFLVTHWRATLVLWCAFAFGRRLPLVSSELEPEVVDILTVAADGLSATLFSGQSVLRA